MTEIPERSVIDMPESLMKLTFRSRPDRLKVVRASIHAAARACGFDDVEAQDIVLAVDEACANVIVHAYDWQEDSDIVIDIFKLDDGIRVQLRDFAETVDPSAIEPRKPDARTPGGLGSYFISSIMDEAKLSAAPDGKGNVLDLVKRTVVQ